MGLGADAGKNAVDELTNVTVPTVLAGVAADIKLATDTIKEVSDKVTDTLIPAVADGITQVLANINRLDGAELTIGPINIEIPAFPIKLSMPMKPTQ